MVTLTVDLPLILMFIRVCENIVTIRQIYYLIQKYTVPSGLTA